MTTSIQTTPDLEAWMARSEETPCEFWGGRKDLCGNPAEWIAYIKADGGCSSFSIPLCDRCKQIVERFATCCYVHFHIRAEIAWVERSRGAA